MKKPMTRISDKHFDPSSPDRHPRNLCMVLAATLLTGGCTVSRKTAGVDAAQKEWEQLAEDSALTAPPAPEFSLMRDIAGEEAADAPRPELLPQISVKDMVITREMDVGVLLRALADAADLNIIISESVSGPTLVSLRRKTRWDRLFLAITQAHGLHYELEDDLLHIFSREDVQRNIAMQQALQEQLHGLRRHHGSCRPARRNRTGSAARAPARSPRSAGPRP